MKIIDARSGKEVRVGETVIWENQPRLVGKWKFDENSAFKMSDFKKLPPASGKEGFTLHALKKISGKLVGDFTIYAPTIPGGKWRRDVPLLVRFLHPSYFFQRVAFIPT
jgi:hypothetical protein